MSHEILHEPFNEQLVTSEEQSTQHLRLVEVDDAPKSRLGIAMHNAVLAAQTAVIAAEVSPLNEVMRLSAFGAMQAHSGDPLYGALAYGGSTLLIEGSAALASASMLASERGAQTTNWINSKLSIALSSDAKMGPAAEAGVALLGGSVVAMAAKQIESPERTKSESRKYGLKVTAFLSGVCAVQGALMAEGIDTMDPGALGAGALSVVGVLGAAKWAKHRPEAQAQMEGLRSLAGDTGLYSINKKHNFIAKETTLGTPEADEALELERAVWKKYDFGDAVEEYKEYGEQTQMFITRDQQEVTGVSRIFTSGPILPPFMKMDMSDGTKYQALVEDFNNGLVEELGTAAKKEGLPKGVISSNMWRLAYRDARERGVKTWGIIMEPERAQELNDRFGFSFEQIGPTEDYQGGDCAPHVMDLQEVHDSMKVRKPLAFYWFVRKKLTT